MNQIICDHVDAEKAGLACEHLLNKGEDGDCRASDYFRFFTGHGADFVLICPACTRKPEKGRQHWRMVCDSCVEDLACGHRLGDIGSPEILVRDAGLTLDHRFVRLAPGPLSVVASEPNCADPRGSWLILTTDSQLMSLDVAGSVATIKIAASGIGIESGQSPSLCLSPNGRFAAVANTYGQTGAVIDLDSRTTTMKLARGNYHTEHCRFPLAFFKADDRQLLIHATDWNRLDISDPATGSCLPGGSPRRIRKVNSNLLIILIISIVVF